MVESYGRFFLDDIEEQIEACRQRPALTSADTRLIHDLYRLYQEDAHIISSVWKRLCNRVAQEHMGCPGSFLPIYPESPE